MGFDSLWHWGLLLLIVLLVFGTRKIGSVGTDLGNAVRGFKQAMRGDEAEQPAAAATERLRTDAPSPRPQAATRSECDAPAAK